MSDAAAYDALGEAKRLLRAIRSGALATLTPEGNPFASLVAAATMPDGSPILLLSKLAAHTRHLGDDNRSSLLLAEGGRGDPLAHPRLTLTGEATPAGARTEAAAARFLMRNPKAKLYASFPDFGFWIVRITQAHLNGGFARAAAFGGEEIQTSIQGCENLLAGEQAALDHMNADHRDAIAVYATRLAGQPEGNWRVSGFDPDGMDLVDGDRTARVTFEPRVRSTSELRARLVGLAANGRGNEI